LYRAENNNVWKSLDWPVCVIYLILVLVGVLSVYGASYDFDHTGLFNPDSRSGMQMLWVGTSLVLAIFIMLIDANNFFNWSFVIYTGIILLLIATIILGSEVKGSKSWLSLGVIKIQPAEFSKFATSLMLARYMSSYNFNIKSLRNVMTVIGILFLPVGLIIFQNETGSALVFFALMLMLYREGMPGFILFFVVCMAAIFVVGLKFGENTLFGQTAVGTFVVLLLIFVLLCSLILVYRKDKNTVRFLFWSNVPVLLIALALQAYGWAYFDLAYVQLALLAFDFLYLVYQTISYRVSRYVLIGLFGLFSAGFLYSVDYAFDQVLEPHQQIRIKVLLGMEDDPSGAGYNVNQSKIAIGSGGFLGKGFLNGTQTKLKYVPEQDTDFIFCTVGEEEGFAGSVFLLGLYLALLLRLISMAERQRSAFSRIYGYCVASILFFHVFVNVGMVLGLIPVIGIPLPFISYGGSSLWAFTILLFIFVRLDADRTQRR
jgi:rod shape determining protein RodA